MASPFRIFRKHQRVMIVVLGVLAMGAFVVIPAALEWLRTSQGPMGGENPVWVTSDFGNKTKSQVERMASNWTKLAQGPLSDMVLILARKVYAEQLQSEQYNTAFIAQMMADYQTRPLRQFLMGVLGVNANKILSAEGMPKDESVNVKSAANIWMLARYAESLGLRADPNVINSTIIELTGGQLSNDEIRDALASSGFSEQAFFETLSDPVLVYRLQQMEYLGGGNLTPAEIRDYYARTQQQAETEIAKINIATLLNNEEFVKSLGEPSDEELEALFNEFKNQDSLPNTPDFGFHQPHEVAIQYITVTPEMRDNWPGITEEQIQEYYEKNRARFETELRRQMQQQIQNQIPPAESGSPQDGSQTETPSETTTETEAGTPAEATTEPAGGTPNETTTEPTVETPTETSTEPPAETPEAPAEETPASDDTSSIMLPSPFFLTSMLQETADESEDTTEPATDEPATDEPAADESATEPATEAEQPAAEPATPTVEPVAEPAEPTAGDDTNPYTDLNDSTPPTTETQPGISPLIRPMVVREVALTKLQDVLQKVKDAFGEYRGARSKYQAMVFDNLDTQLPTYPDVAKIIEPYGLAFQTTPLLAQWQIANMPIGSSQVMDKQGMNLTERMFSSVPLFLPAESIGGTNRYLSWKVRETQASTPKFTDQGVREKVLAAWQFKKAREKTSEMVKKMAEQARESGKPLSEVFASSKDVTVETPPPFKWLSSEMPGPRGQTAYRLSEVAGIDSPGNDFMKVVFHKLSKDNPIGTAMNEPETQAYVIRLISISPDDVVINHNLLRTAEGQAFKNDAAMIAQRDRWEAQRQRLEAIEKQCDFQWNGPTGASLEDSQRQAMPTDINLEEMELEKTKPTE